MKQINNAYWAGLFDGDGHVGIYKTKENVSKSDGRKRNVSYTCKGAISNTNKKVLMIAQKRFGGRIYIRRKTKGQNFDGWAWYLQGETLLGFLSLIRRHTIIKREEVNLALRFLWRQKRLLSDLRGHGFSARELRWRENMRQKMHAARLARSNKGTGEWKSNGSGGKAVIGVMKMKHE